MKNILSDNDKDFLRSLHKHTKDKKSSDRIKCILLLDQGYSTVQVAHILLIDDDTVLNWVKKFENRTSITDWIDDNYKVYSGKLTDEQILEIEKHLTDNIISDSKQLIEFVKESTGITYSLAGMIAFLHRFGYRYKNTTIVPSAFDPEKQKECKKMYEELLNSLSDDEEIYFGDGVHPQHNTICSKAWIKEGMQKEIKSNSGRQRLNIHGAYNPRNQDIVIHEDVTLNAENTIKFMQTIETRNLDKTKIYLFLDNAKYNKNNKVKEYLMTSRIEVIYLPPYSPNLNLIERLWKFMKKKLINNKYYEKFSVFKETILNFFANCDDYKSEIASFIGREMHLIQK